MSYIVHYGVKGMQKGKRRWTNADGSLNEAGKARYQNHLLGKTVGVKEAKYLYNKIPENEKRKAKQETSVTNVSRNASVTKKVVSAVNVAGKSSRNSEGENVLSKAAEKRFAPVTHANNPRLTTQRDAKSNDLKRRWEAVNAQSKKNKVSVATTATKIKARSTGKKVVQALLGKLKKK